MSETRLRPIHNRDMKVAILLLIQIGFVFSAWAQYKVGVENINYLPYFRGDSKNYHGFAQELLDQFAKDQGIEFEYVPLPVKRLYQSFLNKNSSLDFKFPDHENWAQDKKKGHELIYSDGLVEYIDGVLVRPEKSTHKGIKSIGVVRGFTTWDFLSEIKSGKIKLYENSSLVGLIKQVEKGRVDGIYVNIAVAEYLMENELNLKGKLTFNSQLAHTKSTYKMSTLKHEKIILAFNSWLTKNSKYKNKLLEKWKIRKEP